MALRLSDFEEADQQAIQPTTNRNLLALAKQNNLTVTGGFATGGHNTGSRHYQGSPDNPGAIDVDPKAVTPDRIQQWKAQGYTVRDERSHPAGQAKWTGPHYHLEVGTPTANRQQSQPQAIPQPKELIAPFDVNSLQMPVTTDAQGNQVTNKPSKQRDIGKEISNTVKPEASRNVADAPPISLSSFDADQPEIQAISDRLKTKPKPVQPQIPQTPSIGEGLLNVGKAGIKYIGDIANHVGQIPQAIGDEYNQFQKDPNAGLNAYAATGAGVAQGVRDLAQMPLSAPSILQNAYMGHEVSKPLIELPGVKDIPGVGGYLNQAMQDHPVFSTTGNLVGQSLPFELFHGMPKPKELPVETPKPAFKTQADLIRSIAEREGVTPKPEEIHKPYYGFVDRNGELIQKPHEAPEGMRTATPEELNQKPQVKELSTAFADRQKPAEAPQVIDPRNALLPKELGNIKTEPTEGGIELATNAGKREIPKIETASELPPIHEAPQPREIGRTEESNVNTPEPARKPDNATNDLQRPVAREVGQSSILDAHGNPIGRELPTPTIERPGVTKPAEPSALELPRPFERPQPKEIGQVTKPTEAPKVPEPISENMQPRPEGGHVYTQGRDAEAVDQMAQSLENSSSQILALEDAKKLLADKRANGLLTPEEFRKQSDILNLFHEAGRTGKTFQSQRREIKEGEGRISKQLGKAEVKNRDNLAPFAITLKQRKAQTEVSNLVKRLGSAEAARDQLRQIAGKYGITPTTVGKTVRANAKKIAEQIGAHPKGKLEHSDIYLNAHNFKTGGEKTLTDAPRGYPLRTFEGANIGTEKASIPEAALNQSAISKQFKALDQIRNSPDTTPELKQTINKVMDNPNTNFKDVRTMRKAVAEHLQSLCNVWSLK